MAGQEVRRKADNDGSDADHHASPNTCLHDHDIPGIPTCRFSARPFTIFTPYTCIQRNGASLVPFSEVEWWRSRTPPPKLKAAKQRQTAVRTRDNAHSLNQQGSKESRTGSPVPLLESPALPPTFRMGHCHLNPYPSWSEFG
ncbi:hypothetical protein N658DRAFT_183407 [Parathielavia hyrcaniae]|uniref:Uncharacterized protein n=1 Tax=Parathielavia hyrcaniae TaxID=113614 RepID=A0AAN6T494_9PEZI|nr:hypothetical protein N658DRAFT_183407 [Parathielavia hyrcaniae]